ncbi:hypothetical protein ACJJTC_010993 [Scirpophaga incertulas]
MAGRFASLICMFAIVNIINGQETPDCTSRLVTGPCRGRFIRYGVNPDTNKCESFVYGGCAGNKNNYQSQQECEEKCPPDCTSPFAAGRCEALMYRYGFNPATQKCEQFEYGGCGGNRNRYLTLDDCNEQCSAN